MIRRCIRIGLMPLVVGLIAVGWVSTPLTTVPTFASPVSPLTPVTADDIPVLAVAQGFDGDGPIGLGLLNERLEVLFDN